MTRSEIAEIAIAVADELERRGLVRKVRAANEAPEVLTEEQRRAAILKGRKNAKRLGIE